MDQGQFSSMASSHPGTATLLRVGDQRLVLSPNMSWESENGAALCASRRHDPSRHPPSVIAWITATWCSILAVSVSATKSLLTAAV